MAGQNKIDDIDTDRPHQASSCGREQNIDPLFRKTISQLPVLNLKHAMQEFPLHIKHAWVTRRYPSRSKMIHLNIPAPPVEYNKGRNRATVYLHDYSLIEGIQ